MSEKSTRPSDLAFDGQAPALIERVVNLMDPAGNILLNMSNEEAENAVRSGDPEAVRNIRGQFAICQQDGKTIRMARSIGRPMRYFLAKRAEGPALIIAERISDIIDQLKKEGLADQFHASYTRMVPAHYLLELQLVGCPDPNPKLSRYFAPERNRLPADIQAIGAAYIERLAEVIDQFLVSIEDDQPIGVMFSGGIDSGSVLVLVDYLMRRRGKSPSRVKAFTLAIEGHPGDIAQAREFLKAMNLEMMLEPIEVPAEQVRWQDAIASMEDYKPLDVQSATMGFAMLRELRKRYPDWKYLIDGDGGDENLKDYPIEENPELTIRSVLGNRMLYQEGWGVDAVKHSLVYSGGQSRGHSRTSMPAAQFGFMGFSPYAVPDVIEIAEAVPFVALTDWDHKKLYDLKGQIVAAGIKHVTGVDMPVFEKRRFQHGAADKESFNRIFPSEEQVYRDEFKRLMEEKAGN
ncbi:asparagine synthetase B family protein [Stieleria sp. JC731]|uniref:asparagine synthase-related protein n=1 Tax=Pirellulaceae TaxID=2691357 RepID=UPI001E37177A|nr:asparagine synthase-related protein [Stieleria sp. JC731]MCC9601992.1 asparagine synthetase B family protein [Stieleria sp. JC731]